MKKFHIVHVHEKFYPFMGGSTHRLLNLLREIDLNKFIVTVICENSEKIEKYDNYKGINIIRFNSYFEIPKILFNINKKNKIDIIHSHNFRPSFFSFFINRFIFKKPYIIEMHSIYNTNNKIKQFLGNFIIKKSDKIIVLSDSSKNYLVEHLNINSEKVNIIYNGIDIIYTNKEIIEFDDEFLKKNLSDDNIIKITYIGSLDFFQGIDNIIHVINHTNRDNIFFIIIGGLSNEINDLGKKILNKNVYINSYIDKKYTRYIYKNSDFLMVLRPKILSTETAIPLKPLEALLNECKIISTKVGGMIELNNLIKSKNILFFENLNSIVNYINVVQKKDVKIIEKDNLNLFDVKTQSKKLSDLYNVMLK